MPGTSTETKEQVFKRLAEKRTRTALSKIKLLENLGRYPHSVADATKIVSVLKNAVENVEYSLGGDKQKTAGLFTLGEED